MNSEERISKIDPSSSDAPAPTQPETDVRDANVLDSKDVAPEDIERRVEEVAEEFLGQLRRGEPARLEDCVQQHPELDPHLEPRLKLYQSVFKATRGPSVTQAQNSDATVNFSVDAANAIELTDRVEYRKLARRIICPHCGNRLQLVEEAAAEVTCRSCGSSIHVGPPGSKNSPFQSRTKLPQQIGHFKIIRVLGEGGFGIVYLGEDVNLENRPVAIKIPRYGFFATEEEEQRFFREARNAARLRHPHIAQVYEVSENRNTPFIVSEFIDGATLRDLAQEVVLSHREIVELMIQVADAVDFAHRNRIIHRDLKTSNILVDHHNHAYVVDFGLSRREDMEITMTVEGAVIGTVQYMSPEQAEGHQSEVGPHSDIYSLGVILYELLCNELPFHGTKRMMINQVIVEEPRNPRSLNDNVPRDLETITLKAMAKNPRQRYATAKAFAEDMQRWLRGEPILARPVSSLARCWSWCKRHPTIAMLNTAIASLLLLSTAFAVLWSIGQSRSRAAEVIARRKSEQQQYALLTQNGSVALADNDLTAAAMWFSEALSLVDNSTNRTRIGMIQDQIPKLTHLWAIDAPVDAVEFNDAGTRLGIASWNGQVRIVDMPSQDTVLSKDVSPFSHFRLSPTGAKFATCGKDNHALLCDSSDGRTTFKLPHTDIVVSTEFQLAEEAIATGGFDGYARVWNVDDGTLKSEHQFEGLHVNRVAFVPGTDVLLVVTNQPGSSEHEMHLWNYKENRVVASGMRHADHIQAIEFGAAGMRICSASRDGEVRVWDAATGESIGQGLQLPFDPLNVLFDGESTDRILAISYDFDVQFWDITKGQPYGVQIHGLSDYASSALDPSGQLIALGAKDGTVRIYDSITGAMVCTSLHNGEIAKALTFHPEGRRLVVGGRNGLVQVWDLAGAAPASFVFEHAGGVSNAMFSTDGRRCLTIGLDGTGYMWDAESGRRVAVMEHAAGITECTASGDGTLFATASLDNTVKLWDSYSGKQIGSDLPHTSPVVTLTFSPNDRQLTTGCIDGEVACWDVARAVAGTIGEATEPDFTSNHGSRVTSIAYSPQGKLIATSGLDGILQIWNADSGRLEHGPLEHRSTVYVCYFLADGDQLLSCGSDGWVYVWNLPTGEIVDRLECAGSVRHIELFSNGKYLVTDETAGRVRIWKNLNNQFVFDKAIQHPAIASVLHSDVTDDGSTLVFAGGLLAQGERPREGAAVIWDLIEQRQLSPPLVHQAFVRRVHLDATGKKLLTASDDKTARLWSLVQNQLPLEDALRVARLVAGVERQQDGRIEVTSAPSQIAAFTQLSAEYPGLFKCDAAEIELWKTTHAEHQTDR